MQIVENEKLLPCMFIMSLPRYRYTYAHTYIEEILAIYIYLNMISKWDCYPWWNIHFDVEIEFILNRLKIWMVASIVLLQNRTEVHEKLNTFWYMHLFNSLLLHAYEKTAPHFAWHLLPQKLVHYLFAFCWLWLIGWG